MLFKQNQSNLRYANSHGFTLIEILVVISIIALLITIALASFNITRSKADDGKIKQELGLMRLEAEKSYKLQHASRNVCNDTAQYVSNLPSNTTFKCVDGTSGYAFEAVLSTGEYYCVDFFGRERTNTNTAIAAAGANCTAAGDCDCR